MGVLRPKKHGCRGPCQNWWAMRDSNPHSTDYESGALTIKLIAQYGLCGRTRTYNQHLRRVLHYPLCYAQKKRTKHLAISTSTRSTSWI